MLNERTLIEKAVRSQGIPGEVGAAANAIPKRMLKVIQSSDCDSRQDCNK
jgi:hypothetical protein